LGRGPRDAPVDRGRLRCALLSLRPPRRRRARVGLRSRLEDRPPRQGPRRSEETRLDRDEHEGRLEDDLRRRTVTSCVARGRSTKGESPSSRGGTRMRTDPKADRLLMTAVALASAVLMAACASTSKPGATAARAPAKTEVLTVQQL